MRVANRTKILVSGLWVEHWATRHQTYLEQQGTNLRRTTRQQLTSNQKASTYIEPQGNNIPRTTRQQFTSNHNATTYLEPQGIN